MIVIYVGDSQDVVRRIQSNHCGNGTNVEASKLRQHVAECMGYPISKTKRPSGTTKVRLNLPNPHAGEQQISAYSRAGVWKFVICNSREEARDFQWYVIEQLKPLLNVERRPWNMAHRARYQDLLATLISFPGLIYDQIDGWRSGPGVYVLYHEVRPQDFRAR